MHKVLGSNTPLTFLKKEDLGQLAELNIKACNFDKEKLATMISKDITKSYFGNDVKNQVNKLDHKK